MVQIYCQSRQWCHLRHERRRSPMTKGELQ
jgi:hypothetical protein